MGNLVKDFWTYDYKERNYHGIVEVVKGDLQFRKVDGKYETRIEKALEYLMQPNIKTLSHMTVQSYNSYLNKDGRSSRSAEEETYYPFFLEFEPHVKSGQPNFEVEYQRAAAEAYTTAQYMIYELYVDPEDILVVITNSRSIYLFVNPKVYGLKPSKIQHLIYKRMYDILNEELGGFEYVDTSLFRFNGLIKTPGAYYAGGYVVPISVGELKTLVHDPRAKNKLTRKKRSISVNVPGLESKAFKELYISSKEQITEGRIEKALKEQNKPFDSEKSDVKYISSGIGCINYLESAIVEPGQRNFALVSLAIAYKNGGYSIEQVNDILQERADKWGHDEDAAIVRSKVKTVFTKDTKFSCSYIKEHVNICDSCRKCKLNKKAVKGQGTKFKVNKYVIDQLRANKGSLRHYKAYLIMSRNELFGQYFNPEEFGLDHRVIREFSKFTGATRELESGQVKIDQEIEEKNYLIPNEFVDKGSYESLGERLKQYLILYTSFTYKAGDKYGMMHVKAKKVNDVLGYKNIESTYSLIKELVDMGMAVYKNGFLFAMYYSTYKVISLEDYKAEKSKKKAKEKLQYQDKIEYDYELLGNGDHQLFLKCARGSP